VIFNGTGRSAYTVKRILAEEFDPLCLK